MTTAPGPNVTTGLRAGPPPAAAPKAAAGFIPVIAGYGPTTPNAVHSLAEYNALYRPDYVDAAHALLSGSPAAAAAALVELFFQEGGQVAYPCRLVGPAAVKATHVFVDRAGSPAPALTITAKTAGVWGNDIKVQVADGTASNSYKLTFTLAAGAGILATMPPVIDNLMTPAAGKAAIDADPVLSTLVDVVAGTGVGVTNRPAVVASTALSTGADDVGGVTTGVALAAFPADLGPGVVFGPALGTGDGGTFATGLAASLATLEAARRTAIYPATILGGDVTTYAANVATLRAALVTAGNSSDRADELLSYVAAFQPGQVLVPGADGSATRRVVDATGYVAGQRARVLADYGYGRTPAGEVSASRWAIGPTVDGVTTTNVDDATAATIDTNLANALRVIAGRLEVYGWRTPSTNVADWGQLSTRDTLNVIASDADDIAEGFTFRRIDSKGHVFAQLNAELAGMMQRYRVADVLYPRVATDGAELDPGYAVDTGPNVNTPTTIAGQQINADIGARISPTGSTVNIRVSKVATGAPL